jgi:4-amino-4-deoxy-L-arabinose transferase-like glycosyltransferase
MKNPAFWVVLAALVFRLIFASFTGLGIDESYMVAASNHFSASYFDHPPISWWLELTARKIFGAESPIIVRLPFIAISGLSAWLLYALTARLYGPRAGFWAVTAYTISPVFSLAFGCWVLPDGPLDAALLASAYALSQALGIAQHPTTPKPAWWFAAGALIGLALLCKYTASLTLAGAFLVLLTDPESRKALKTWHPYAAALIALALFSPVIAWNLAHHWQSFSYQSGRAAGLRLRPLAPFTILGGEALFILPWLWLPMVMLLIAALRRGPAERRGWMLTLLAIIPIALFALIGLWSSTKILYHWATPGYLLLLPIVGNWAATWRPAWRNSIAIASATLLAGAAMFITAEESFAFIPELYLPFPPGKSPLLQALDWESLRTQIPPDADAIATLRWYDAGKIAYGIRNALPVTVFGPEPHQFGISDPPKNLIGKNILIIAMPGDISNIASQYAPFFQSITPAPALTITHGSSVLLVIPTLLGHNLLTAPP